MQTAAQKEDDREAKLAQKAALYDRLHSGQACSTSNASELLVDFEKMIQEQGSSTATPGGPPPKPTNFQPIEFRQRGLIQVSIDQHCLSCLLNVVTWGKKWDQSLMALLIRASLGHCSLRQSNLDLHLGL